MESTRRWSSYVPPLALMGLIFFLSAQQSLDSGPGVLGLVVRKVGHMAVFGLLALLWWRALGNRTAAVVVAVAYAVTDEVHQSFVPGRYGSPVDVLIDTAGVLLAVYLADRLGPWVSRRSGGGASGRSRRGP